MNLRRDKSTQIFTIINYQKKVLIISLSVILISSVFRTGKNYYSKVFLEECKYVFKEKDETGAWVYYWRHMSSNEFDEKNSN